MDKSRFYLYHTKHQTNQTKRYNTIYCFVDASLHFVPSKRVVIVNEKSVEPSWDLSYKGRAFLPHFCKPQGEKHTINNDNNNNNKNLILILRFFYKNTQKRITILLITKLKTSKITR